MNSLVMNNFFKVLRGGTHSTFQDNGFVNKQHLGITTGGAVDYELYTLSNGILNNSLNESSIEFCFQGPCLKLISGKSRFVITGNVSFNIITSSKTISGTPFKSYLIKEGDIIDIFTTVKSNYGYLSVEGGFKLIKQFGSFSTLTIAKIGANNGNKIQDNQKILINGKYSNINSKINYINDELTKIIRIIPGPQMNYFLPRIIEKFLNEPFIITNESNRMGVRLKGNICKPIKSPNIPSEGIVKGSIQIPGDGNPIILMNDHPTIGGYPKIASVSLVDIAKIAQLPIGSEIIFKKILLKEAELLYKKMSIELNKKLKFIEEV